MSDNLISKSLIRSCKKALEHEAIYNNLASSIEQSFMDNYTREDIEEILNICETYAHPKDVEAIREVHQKYLNRSPLTPADILLIQQSYKTNIKRLRDDNAKKYNRMFKANQNDDMEES